FTIFNNYLVAGGTFNFGSSLSIAAWNGTLWYGFGTGLDNVVHALAVYNNSLYAGGSFTSAGGNPANYIAKWNGTLSVNQISNIDNIGVLSPNPLTSTSILQLNIQLKEAEVIIYNMLGEEKMKKKLSGNKMEIEKGSLNRGVYFVAVISN